MWVIIRIKHPMTTLKLRPEPQKEVPSEDQATANLGYLYISFQLQ